MTDNDRIELTVTRLLSARLNSLERIVTILTEKIDNMVKPYDEQKTATKELEKTVYGNGDKEGGLVGRLQNHSDWIEGQKKFQFLLVSVLVGQLIGLGFLLVTHVLVR